MGMGTRSEARGILPARAIARYCEEGLIRLARPALAIQEERFGTGARERDTVDHRRLG